MYKLKEINKELDNLANVIIPINNTIAEIEMELLKQQNITNIIREEKEIEAILKQTDDVDNANEHHKYLIHELKEFNKISKIINKHITEEIQFIESKLANPLLESTKTEAELILSLLVDLKEEYDEFHNHALAFIQSNNGSNKTISKKLEKEESQLIEHIEFIFKEIETYTETAALRANEHEKEGLIFTTIANIITGLLGVIIGILLSNAILKPLFNLVTNVEYVENGNLDVQTKITSRDELGTLGKAFNKMVTGLKHKEEIKQIFGQYIDPRIVTNLIATEKKDIDQPKNEKVSIFFSDIKKFTKISEALETSQLVKLINDYFSIMSIPINEQNGIIDKYIGDSIMAFWAPPFSKKNTQSTNACYAALKTIEKSDELNNKIHPILKRTRIKTLGFRIGIATGNATVGSIGPSTSKSFTVMGDTINIGARLEAANKIYGTKILVCESTKKESEKEFEFKKIDTIRLVGKSIPLSIYELVAKKGELEKKDINLINEFEIGLQHYQNSNWKLAKKCFNNCLVINKDDNVSKLFLNRIETLEKDPPNSNWDGIWTYTKK